MGITLQATTTRHEDRVVAAAGVSFYPMAETRFGIPVGVGYQGRNVGGTVGYDLRLKTPVISGGYINTRGDKSVVPVG